MYVLFVARYTYIYILLNRDAFDGTLVFSLAATLTHLNVEEYDEKASTDLISI